MKYTLTATLKGQSEKHTIETNDEMAAGLEAINYVMTKAFDDKTGLWAKGRITLQDEDGNDVVDPMEEKE